MRGASALLLTSTALALVGCADSTSTRPATGGGVGRSDQSQEAAYSEQQRNYVASLDALLSEHDYTKLTDAVRSSPDASLIVPTLDWGKSRTMAGASLIVPLLYATKLWSVGSASSQYASLRETAGLIAVYALMVTYADGVKCADQTAPGHRIDAILAQYRDLLKMLAESPVDRRAILVDTAARMETATAPLRTNDNYLCRFGMQETIDNLKKYEGKEIEELPPQSGQVGKQFRIPDDADYEPRYIPREQWEPKQQMIRTELRPAFTTLLAAAQRAP